MARDWQVENEDGKLVYTLTLEGDRGVFVVKEEQHDYGTSWDIYHEGVLLKKGWEDATHSIEHCNELAERLS